jgi:hypothetical protein
MKRFLSSTYGIYLLVVLGFFALLFIIGFITSGQAYESALFSAGITVITLVALIVNETYGKKKHKTILDGEVFLPFKRELGFLKEELNAGEYHGYKGVYKRFFFRVYYDWNTSETSSRNAWREVCIMLYFEPVLTPSNELDIVFLNGLNHKYKDKNLITSPRQKIIVEASHIRLHRTYNLLTRFRHLKKRLDQLVEIAEKEGLKSIKESDVDELMKSDPYLHGPTIESFSDGFMED